MALGVDGLTVLDRAFVHPFGGGEMEAQAQPPNEVEDPHWLP